jgi:hypothetical protein
VAKTKWEILTMWCCLDLGSAISSSSSSFRVVGTFLDLPECRDIRQMRSETLRPRYDSAVRRWRRVLF